MIVIIAEEFPMGQIRRLVLLLLSQKLTRPHIHLISVKLLKVFPGFFSSAYLTHAFTCSHVSCSQIISILLLGPMIIILTFVVLYIAAMGKPI